MDDVTRFAWHETSDVLAELAREGTLRRDADGRRGLVLERDGEPLGVRVELPAIFPLPDDLEDIGAYVETLDDDLGIQLVVLLQAGAAAIAVFDDGEPVRHKAIKKYVVRGTGKAQSTHLKTKGKSRYGSRLRLRNANALLDEVQDKVAEWDGEFGPFDSVWYSCPVRLWADLLAARTGSALEGGDDVEVHRIPLHVHVPTYKELERVYRLLTHGRVVRGSDPRPDDEDTID